MTEEAREIARRGGDEAVAMFEVLEREYEEQRQKLRALVGENSQLSVGLMEREHICSLKDRQIIQLEDTVLSKQLRVEAAEKLLHTVYTTTPLTDIITRKVKKFLEMAVIS